MKITYLLYTIKSNAWPSPFRYIQIKEITKLRASRNNNVTRYLKRKQRSAEWMDRNERSNPIPSIGNTTFQAEILVPMYFRHPWHRFKIDLPSIICKRLLSLNVQRTLWNCARVKGPLNNDRITEKTRKLLTGKE